MRTLGNDEVANECVVKGWVKGGVTINSLPKQLKFVWTWNLTKQHHDYLCEWTCLPTCWWCSTLAVYLTFLRSEIDFLVAKTAPELTTKLHPSMWCYMDPEPASRPGFGGCRQVTGYGQLLHGDLAPVSFFQGTKTDSWQNYICTGGST